LKTSNPASIFERKLLVTVSAVIVITSLISIGLFIPYLLKFIDNGNWLNVSVFSAFILLAINNAIIFTHKILKLKKSNNGPIISSVILLGMFTLFLFIFVYRKDNPWAIAGTLVVMAAAIFTLYRNIRMSNKSKLQRVN
jgi:hypothetical protein